MRKALNFAYSRDASGLRGKILEVVHPESVEDVILIRREGLLKLRPELFWMICKSF